MYKRGNINIMLLQKRIKLGMHAFLFAATVFLTGNTAYAAVVDNKNTYDIIENENDIKWKINNAVIYNVKNKAGNDITDNAKDEISNYLIDNVKDRIGYDTNNDLKDETVNDATGNIEDESNSTDDNKEGGFFYLKDGGVISGEIVKENGNSYYRYSNGKKAKNQFMTVNNKTYYFGKKGIMEKGWMKKGGNYYYFDRATGVQKSGAKVDGIKIKKNGQAKMSSYNVAKIETMLTAKSIMNKVTNPSDTKEQKLKKVFNWVLKHSYKRYRTLRSIRSQKGWETIFANDIYKKGNGCCVSEASAFAFLAHECGYAKVYICDDTGHAWTEINGHVYDTLFAEAKNYNSYYNSSYSVARLYCVNKLLI